MRIYLNLPNRVSIEQTDSRWIYKTNVFWIEHEYTNADAIYLKTMGEGGLERIHGVREVNIVAGYEILK